MKFPLPASRHLGAALLATCSLAAFAQDYPAKPVRILGGPPGGSSDFTARLIAQGLTPALGQSVIVENKGSGVQAILQAARSPADGYTLLFYGSSLWTGPLLEPVEYDVNRDFAPVTLAMMIPSVLMVHPGVPAKSVKELVALARAKPGELNYASGPLGTTTHVYAELFRSMTGTSFTRISYGGGGPATRALIAGEVQVLFGTVVDGKANIQSGKARGLAVTSAQRIAAFPDLPTIAESGLPGYEGVQYAGVFAPAGTSTAVINRLHQETAKVLAQDDVRQKLANVDAVSLGGPPQEFARIIKAETSRLAPVLKGLAK